MHRTLTTRAIDTEDTTTTMTTSHNISANIHATSTSFTNDCRAAIATLLT
jgi:hypothetical protein